MAFIILFTDEARKHLRTFPTREQKIIVSQIKIHLLNEPLTETRRRKRMRPNPLAPWELRIDTFRVFYDVESDTQEVIIIAIGEKKGNRVFIGGEEVQL